MSRTYKDVISNRTIKAVEEYMTLRRQEQQQNNIYCTYRMEDDGESRADYAAHVAKIMQEG